MVHTNLLLRLPADDRPEFLTLLQSERTQTDILVKRVSTWRSAEITLVDVLVTLASAGSLTALAAILKAWFTRKRGTIEIISEKTGVKVTFEGPLDQPPLEQLRKLLESPALTKTETSLLDKQSFIQSTEELPQPLTIDRSTQTDKNTNENERDGDVSSNVSPTESI
jgi:hypothetical protein